MDKGKAEVPEDGRTPFERMTDFARKIIQVPKDEVPEHKPVKRRPKVNKRHG